MLPFIIGGAIVAVATYAVNKASSDNSRARRDYDDTSKTAKKKIKKSFSDAQRKDALDKLYKVREAKKKIANSINTELQKEHHHLKQIGRNINVMNMELCRLRKEKKDSREEINLLIASIKEISAIHSSLKEYNSELSKRLKDVNKEISSIQDEINKLLKN